ncbi:MAG: carbohydrate ABC transporter permease [Bacteroidales bacterium]|nr:carbohydrate ABC transporter permease [Bacteroidales bacterium]
MKAKTKIKKTVNSGAVTFAVLVMCFISVMPYFYMVIVSFKDKRLVYMPEVWIFKPTFINYINIFQKNNLGHYLINSAIISFANCILSLTLGSMTAYALARYKFKRKEGVAFYLLFIRILPAVVSVIPLYVLAAWMKILDTHVLLITVYLLFNIPYTVLMMRGFFEEIPVEVEEAATIDGCTRLQTLSKVVIPLAMPGLVATAIFCLINAWNEFVYASLLSTFKVNTVPTIVQLYKSVSGIVWGEMSATGTIATLPAIIFAALVQKQMVRGLSCGAVKG